MTDQSTFTALSPAQIELMSTAVRGKPMAMVNFARTFLRGNEMTEPAREMCRDAVALDPDNSELWALSQPVLCQGIGSWYFTMVQDEWRHGLYLDVLSRKLANGGTVLDIGAGTGLFAMLAAQAGADLVIACESDPAVAWAAAKIVEQNGLSDKVKILPIASQDLVMGEHLSEPADMLLWDNLANNCIGAGCVKTLADAHARLIKPGAFVIPGRVEVMAAIVGSDRAGHHRMGVVDDFDMSAFNLFAPTDYTSGADHHPLLCEPVALFDFDFTSPTPMQEARNSASVMLVDGEAYGVLQWLRFHLDEKTVYDTRDERVHAFGPQFHAFAPFTAVAGTTVQLYGAHDTSSTWFWVEK